MLYSLEQFHLNYYRRKNFEVELSKKVEGNGAKEDFDKIDPTKSFGFYFASKCSLFKGFQKHWIAAKAALG